MMLLFICARGGRLIEVYQSRLSRWPELTRLAPYPGLSPVPGAWCVDVWVGNSQRAYFYFQFTQNLVILLLRVSSFTISYQIHLLKHLTSSHPNLHFRPESRGDD